jgi:hypothetical protein
VHIKFIEDRNGDLIEMWYYHHACCPRTIPSWPCPEAVDYPVYCFECNERILEVPLTQEGQEMLDQDELDATRGDRDYWTEWPL